MHSEISSELSNVYWYVFDVFRKMQPVWGSKGISETKILLKNFEEIMTWLQDLIKLCENLKT